MSEDNYRASEDSKRRPLSEDSKLRQFSGTIAFVVCFMIGCMFLYWAVEYWVYNSFDANRYELSKIQVGNSDSLSIWKLDKRTGGLEYCTKSYDKMDHFVCVHASTLEAKEYSDTPEPLKTPAMSADATADTATSPATNTATDPMARSATDPMAKNATDPMAKTATDTMSSTTPQTSQVNMVPSTQNTSNQNATPPMDSSTQPTKSKKKH